MNKKTILTALLGSTLSFAALATQPAVDTNTPFVNEYLGDIAQNNPEIATSFANLIKDAPQETAWLNNYGTASPGVLVTINDTDYVAFSACEPKNCPNSGYVAVLDPRTNDFIKGAVRYESAENTTPHQTTVVWLKEYDTDFVPTIWQQFYLAN